MARIRHLRVRIKELASEAGHIRHEERQCSGYEKWNLQHHRKTTVRRAAREAQLAYACLRGVDYCIVEPYVRDPGEAKRRLEASKKVATRFGGDPEQMELWYEHAVDWLKAQIHARKDAA
jgi:hypothetical protein